MTKFPRITVWGCVLNVRKTNPAAFYPVFSVIQKTISEINQIQSTKDEEISKSTEPDGA